MVFCTCKYYLFVFQQTLELRSGARDTEYCTHPHTLSERQSLPQSADKIKGERKEILLTCSLQMGNRGTERLNDLSKVT